MFKRLALLIRGLRSVGVASCGAGAMRLMAAAPVSVAMIAVDPAAESLERFAARELQRYVYATTGELLPILTTAPSPSAATFVVTARKHPLGQRFAGSDAALPPQGYRIASFAGSAAGGPAFNIIGGDAVGTLYGVYRFVEKPGVRFYLSGDVIPDQRRTLGMPPFVEEGRPIFAVRGLQPFHDFAEGPDWWREDDYHAHLGQMAKLRLNFLGLHTYPESQVGPEPTVWIGQRGDYDEQGQVRVAYPASYHTTGRSGRTWWAYAPLPTSEFTGGAAGLFERDDFGADVMRDHSFEAQTPETAAVVFNRTAGLLRLAFARARQLGILTCVGTETPLTVPAPVRAQLERRGLDPDDPAVTRQVYAAIFDRIRRAYPVDYYWLWTPENWTWEGNHPEQFARTAADIQAALDALADLGHPMTLATCGWVLGPQQDRSALDRLLPPNSPMSAINSSVGHVAIERQFANLSDRPRWAIPWLENDGGITAPQFWAARLRYDAADARRLGATGLIGIHWRTRILSPAIAALADAAWDQSWTPAGFATERIPPLTASGATGGRNLEAVGPVSGPGDLEAYRTNRVGMEAYDLLVPSGRYRIRLGFSELAAVPAGTRVFSVKLNGQTVIERLDLAGSAGVGRAVPFDLADYRVNEGRLLIEFVPHAGEPAIAVIDLEAITDVGAVTFNRRINCGGPELPGFEADQLPGQPRPPIDRAMPIDGFYRDFAVTNFGPEAGPAVGEVFTALDGTGFPTPAHWIDGPGDIRREAEPWSAMSQKYAFVERLEALRSQVRGAANLERYDYWLNQLRAMHLLAEVGCTAGELDREMAALAEHGDSAARTRALPLRLKLASLWTTLLRTHVAAVSNVGELGTLANLEQRSRVHQKILSRHDDALVKLLGHDLPLAAWPERSYAGPPRIVVPTVRTSASAGERMELRVLLVSEQAPEGDAGALAWRPLGGKDYQTLPLWRVGRRVYAATLPPLTETTPAIEYHVTATLDGERRRWPVSERGLDQIVVLQD